MDNIDTSYALKKRIKIYKTNTTPAPAVAEHVLGLMIDISRKISGSFALLKSGKWEKHMGSLIQGKTLGIIGLGTIGKELVKITKSLNLKILAYDQIRDKSFAVKHNIEYCDLRFLLRNSNFVSIHLDSNKKTKHFISANELSIMNPNAYIINTSRGEIVDEIALLQALKNNYIAGAAIDVFETEPYIGPLRKLNNIVLTPHIAAYAKEVRDRMEQEAIQNIIKGLNAA